MTPFPKPKDLAVPQMVVWVHRNGREECNLLNPDGKMLYIMRRFIAWLQQGKRCSICQQPLLFREAVTDHIIPRGHGGGFRDDRLIAIQATCWTCNQEKASRRY